ncbi:MAG TPA: hypothetical protein VKY89_12520 [Thermoanaerobaculia bacterium]|nr:hypothetical protein [Thermoanaerobaculia bacterium]
MTVDDQPAAAPRHTACLTGELASADLVRRITAALNLQWPQRPRLRGWVAADATLPRLPWVTVHLRPWLSDPGEAPGMRREAGEGPLRDRAPAIGYGLVLLARDPASLVEPALAALRAAMAQGQPNLCVFGFPGEITFPYQGERLPLPAAPPQPAPEPLRLELRGRGPLALDTTLPATVRIRGTQARHFLLARAGRQADFGARFERFEIRSRDGSAIGEVALLADLRTEPGGSDRLTLAPAPADVRIEVRSAGLERPQRPRRFPSSGALRLHVLFDRTTLDVESWPRALAALTSRSAEVNEAAAPKGRWNLQLRQQLAAGLQASVHQLHRRPILDFWWFADQPRPGIAQPDGLPIAATAWGHPGELRLEQLPAALLGRDFDYASGMDLFDAVDEALEQVAGRIAGPAATPQAVLIVGDSPPPPADEQDPLWRRIVAGDGDGAPRTNARRSPRFRRVLADLDAKGVPVGWLFIRHPGTPEAQPADLDLRPRFQTLREEVLAALQHHPPLAVEACDPGEDVGRSLGALFARLNQEPEAEILPASERS